MSFDQTPLQNFIINKGIGFASAAISATIGAPLERIQVLLQTQAANPQIDQSNR